MKKLDEEFKMFVIDHRSGEYHGDNSKLEIEDNEMEDFISKVRKETAEYEKEEFKKIVKEVNESNWRYNALVKEQIEVVKDNSKIMKLHMAKIEEQNERIATALEEILAYSK